MQQPTLNSAETNQNRPRQERMTFRIYLRTFWMDYLVMVLLGALALGINFLRPASDRVFPLFFHDGEVVNPEWSYPFRKNIIPSWLAALIAFIIPFICILSMQTRLRSLNDVNAALMGLLFSLLTSTVFQVSIKWLIGGLRPYFFSVCKLNINATSAGSGQGFYGLMFDRSICTGDEKEINYALQTMPSGHSAIAFAGLLYCSLYLNGKLKIFSNYRSQYWKFVLFFSPLLAATLVAASLTIDYYHHWSDVLAGSVIGIMFAFGAYRFQYASVWDYRFNHVPLPRLEDGIGFDYRHDDLQNAMSASRKCGWDDRHMYGAPFDAYGH